MRVHATLECPYCGFSVTSDFEVAELHFYGDGIPLMSWMSRCPQCVGRLVIQSGSLA